MEYLKLYKLENILSEKYLTKKSFAISLFLWFKDYLQTVLNEFLFSILKS